MTNNLCIALGVFKSIREKYKTFQNVKMCNHIEIRSNKFYKTIVISLLFQKIYKGAICKYENKYP